MPRSVSCGIGQASREADSYRNPRAEAKRLLAKFEYGARGFHDLSHTAPISYLSQHRPELSRLYRIGQQPYSLLVHSMALVRELRFRPGLRVSSRLVGVLHRAVPSAAPSRRERESDRFLAQIEKTPRTSADDNVFLSRARRHGSARYRLGP